MLLRAGDEPIGAATLSLEQIQESNGDVICAPVMSKKGMAGELEVTASVADTLASVPPATAAKVSTWAWLGFGDFLTVLKHGSSSKPAG
jgi:hypothetical protein